MNYDMTDDMNGESNMYGHHSYNDDPYYDDPYYDDPYNEDPHSGDNITYDNLNDTENSIYVNAFLWGVCIVSFTYCTVMIVNACGSTQRPRDTDLNAVRLLDETTDINERDIEYSEIDYDEKDCKEICPICFVEYKEGDSLIKLNCSHIYHKECVFDWFKKNRNCPLCRLSV